MRGVEGALARANPPRPGARQEEGNAAELGKGLSIRPPGWPGGRQREVVAERSPALTHSICSHRPPRGASAVPPARGCLGQTQSCSYLCPGFPAIRVACLEVKGADCPTLSPALAVAALCHQAATATMNSARSLAAAPKPLWCPGAATHRTTSRRQDPGRGCTAEMALLAAGRCTEVARSCGDGELWRDAGGHGPFVPTSGVPAQCGRRLWRGANLCPVHPSAPSLAGTPSSMQGDPAPAASIPPPARGGTPCRQPGQNPQLLPTPGAHWGVKAGFAPSWAICSRIEAKGGAAGRGVPIAASPPQVPSRCAWPAASTGSGSCDGAEAARNMHKALVPCFSGRERS